MSTDYDWRTWYGVMYFGALVSFLRGFLVGFCVLSLVFLASVAIDHLTEDES